MIETIEQLTYTSFDTHDGGAGGWQVKERTCGFTEDDLTTVRALVSTDFELVTPLPQFPSTAEIESRPRRLVVRTDESGVWFLVHAVSAGADGSGRPGNVFNHVLAAADLGTSQDEFYYRPLQWWGSTGWLTPYGADAVANAVLPATAPSIGHQVSRAGVTAFLSAAGRAPGLSALLDAVNEWLDGGRPVALVAEDQDEAVMWLAALSYLASPETNRALSLSTYERAHRLRNTIGVSVMPREDLDEAIRIDSHIVVDPASPRLSSEPTDWRIFAETLLDAPPEHVSMRLLALDEIALLNPVASARARHWALAVAVAEDEVTAGALPTALAVLRQVPIGAIEHDEIRTIVAGLVGSPADLAADQWAPTPLPTGEAAPSESARQALELMLHEEWMPDGTSPQERAVLAIEQYFGDAEPSVAELAFLLRGINARPDLDLVPLATSVLAHQALGDPVSKPLAWAIRAGHIDGRPLPSEAFNLAALFILWEADWWRASRDAWVTSLQLLACGLPVFEAMTTPAELIERLRPELVLAAVRSIVWSRDPLAPSVTESYLLDRLPEINAHLDDLQYRLGDSRDGLAAMVGGFEDLAIGALGLVAQARFGYGDDSGLLSTRLLVTDMEPADVQALGYQTLGEFLVGSYVSGLANPRVWLSAQVQALEIYADQQDEFESWIGTFGSAVPTAAHVDETASRSVTWPQPD